MGRKDPFTLLCIASSFSEVGSGALLGHLHSQIQFSSHCTGLDFQVLGLDFPSEQLSAFISESHSPSQAAQNSAK